MVKIERRNLTSPMKSFCVFKKKLEFPCRGHSLNAWNSVISNAFEPNGVIFPSVHFWQSISLGFAWALIDGFFLCFQLESRSKLLWHVPGLLKALFLMSLTWSFVTWVTWRAPKSSHALLSCFEIDILSFKWLGVCNP